MRDMRESAMQFAALILLCMLGVFLFSGIDAIALITRHTNDACFARNKLAHLWITLPEADRDALARVRAIDGVDTAAARFVMDMEVDLPGDPVLKVTAFDGAMDVNVPVVRTGRALDPADRRGCLMQEAFAQARGLRTGDRITLVHGRQRYTLTVRGIVNSPEYINVADGMSIDTAQYGYLLCNAATFAGLPLTEIAVRLEDGADAQAVREAVQCALPAAFIVGRDVHASTQYVENNATMYRSLSIMFPLAAYAVAAMIVMTTLGRMIDNQRQQIGTLRALGYSAGSIRLHYVSYAVVPSVIGSLLGVLLGFYGLPAAVWDMLAGQSEYPFLVKPPVSAQSLAIAGLNVLVSAAICLYAFEKTTKESAAALLRPKPPRAGARIFLERIAPLWSRLSFNAKMIVRNLLRSPLRTLMSCVGLLCCNVLLIASMGLQDSVLATIRGHYGGTLAYDACASLSDPAGDADAYERRIDAARVECVMETSVSLRAGDRQRTTQLTVVGDGQTLLHLGEGGTAVPLTGGAILTHKLARTLGVSVGEEIACQLPGDDSAFAMTVTQIVENNLSQGMYLTRSAWEGLRKGGFVPTAIYMQEPTAQAFDMLEKMDEVEDIDRTSDLAEEALIFLHAVSTVFSILTVIALTLAFVICYNMGLINFAERTREYATLKVLGYRQREIRRLILMENVIITLAAIAISIVPGVAFTGAILALVESESMRYVSAVAPTSIAIGSLTTFGFSVCIQLLLARKVRAIVMVEALKSVE